jgi:hypothetical protein
MIFRSQNWCWIDDGHLFGIFCLEVLRDAHAGGIGQERDEKMMLAGEMPRDRDFAQNLANNAPQVRPAARISYRMWSCAIRSCLSSCLCIQALY